MSTQAQTIPASSAAAPASGAGMMPLVAGLAGIGITVVGFFVAGASKVAASWLIALTFFLTISLGMLFLVMIHHIFDSGWSTVVRRQLEHGIGTFKWLAVLFLPLILLSWFYQPDLLWKWMNPAFDFASVGGHGTVGDDPLWVKKAAYLNMEFFTIRYVLFFGSWILLAAVFRRNSFSQDRDGDPRWTLSSRKWAAGGLFLAGLTSTFAAFDWLKSLEYHWFSTMYGVWFFATSIRAALSVAALICIYLIARQGRGVIKTAHLYDIGKLMFAFTVFWAYITFSQYFLIWNANIPEETFWFNIREHGNWWWVGMAILFGHFALPFIYLLSYKAKVIPARLAPVAIWILAFVLLDLFFNIMPFKKDAAGDPLPFGVSIWDVSALVGVGGIWLWSYIKSFGTAKLIPIRDPRIVESLQHRE
jgi:hypothetical protein